MTLRQTVGALLYDWPSFERQLRGVGRESGPEPWLLIRNRNESISTDGTGVQCNWRFSSELNIANVFPSASARLMRRALTRWPIVMRDTPAEANSRQPRISFLIGHRGSDRLPHLLATLRALGGQSGPAFECIVVEQSLVPEVRELLPPWVRYIHTPLPVPDLPYCRAWAFNVAAAQALGDVLVLHDNDILVPECYAAEALARIEGGAAFVDLKRFMFYLGERDTAAVFETGVVQVAPSKVMQNLEGGSIIARRDAYEMIGGFDEEFIGWGGEDNEFFERAHVFGNVNRFAYLPLIHLHHQSQPGKREQSTAAIERYRALQVIGPGERIARLRQRARGRMNGPASG